MKEKIECLISIEGVISDRCEVALRRRLLCVDLGAEMLPLPLHLLHYVLHIQVVTINVSAETKS